MSRIIVVAAGVSLLSGCELQQDECVLSATRVAGECVVVDAGSSPGGSGGCGASTWYGDADGDGDGDPAEMKTACSPPTGYVDNADDLDPGCGRKEPSAGCTPGSGRCTASAVSNRETCVDDAMFPGCTDWKASARCGASAPVCGGGGVCGKCSMDADCAGDGQVCDTSSGSCVQCTSTNAFGCGGDVCDSLKRTCAVGVKPASADLCEACVSDAQCGETTPALCMPTSFKGTNTGYACQPKRDPESGPAESCINDHRPYAGAAVDADAQPLASIDGAQTPACRLRTTTCAALRDLNSGNSCAGSSASAMCGAPSLDDGVCAPVPAEPVFACSVPCANDLDCYPGSTCTGARFCSL